MMRPIFHARLDYRWVIFTAASSMLAIVMGQLVNGLSAFFTPLEVEFGWKRGDIALINTSGLIGIGLGGAVMGFAADRFNMRAVILIGAVMTGIGFVAASRADALWQLYVIFFLAGALGGGATFAPLFALVGNWFHARAGLAIGIASAGQAIGQGGVPFANTLLINSFGWRGAFLSYGVFALAVLVPLALLMRMPLPGQQAGQTFVVAAASSPVPLRSVIVMMSAAVLLCCSLMSVPLIHLVPLLQGCGIPAPEAGSVVFVMMIAAIAGRIGFGRLADKIGAISAYFVASAWQTALVILFTKIGDLTLLYIFAPIYGFGYAGVMTGVLTTIRALTPVNNRASATGLILAFAWAGHGLGGYVGGLLFDLTGTYDLTFMAAAASGALNLVIVAALLIMTGHARHKCCHA
jgi:MFS family permease